MIAAIGIPIVFTLLTLNQVRVFWPVAISEALLLALVAVAASAFTLIAGIAALIISLGTDPLDRQRMMRRYRLNAFNFVAVYSLVTIFCIVLATVLLPRGRDGSITGPFEWFVALFGLLLAGVGWLTYYVHGLVTTRSEQKIRWLEQEIEHAILTAMVSIVATAQLEALLDALTERRVRWKYDVSMDWVHRDDDIYCWPEPIGGGYLKDVSVRRVKAWLKRCGLTIAGDGHLAAVMLRNFHPGDAISVVRLNPTGTGLEQRVRSLAGACQLVAKNPAGQLQISLKDLRDRAWRAAHEGATGQFESILETFTRLVVRLYTVEDKMPADILSEDRRPYMLPSVLLRAAVTELGEEVFRVESPNTIKAWMHFPHRLLKATRLFPRRRVWALTYPWWRAAQLIRQWGAERERVDDRQLLLESFTVRLHYYVEELVDARKEATPVIREALSVEIHWLLRVLARLLSAAEVTEYPGLRSTLAALLKGDPDLTDRRIPWLLCARHLLADFVEFSGEGACSVAAKWEAVKEVYSTLNELISDYVSLRDSPTEDTEHHAYQLYAQSIDLTWEEQWEVGLGRWVPLIKGDPVRDLKLVTLMLAIDRTPDASTFSALDVQQRRTLCELLKTELNADTSSFFHQVAPERATLPEAARNFELMLRCSEAIPVPVPAAPSALSAAP